MLVALFTVFVSLCNSQRVCVCVCVCIIQGLPGKAGGKGAKGGVVSISVYSQLT